MVATTAYPHPLQAPTQSFRFVEEDGTLSNLGMSTMNAIWAALNGANVIVPCSCNQASVNVIALTPLITSPVPQQQSSSQAGVYTVFSTWAFVATATTTNTVTASINPLGALNVYTTNGGTAAGAGSITIGRQYFLTYVDTLNANAGGFVLR